MNTKVQAAGAAGALTTVLVWVVGLPWIGLEVPPEVAAAVTTLIATGAGWLIRERNQGGNP